jgi:hypothetical protein
MANQSNRSYSESAPHIPHNASEEQASQIVGYGIGDIVMLTDPSTSDLSSGGTSVDTTPNSTSGPGMARSGSDMANINVGYSSGNSAANPRDSHQASMSNSAPGQQFLVSRYDELARLFFAYKVDEKGKHDNTEVPLAADENYEVVKKAKTTKAKTTKANTTKAKPDKAKLTKEKTTNEKTDKEKTTKEKTDKATAVKATADKAKTDKTKTDKANSTKANTDKTKTDKAKTDKAKTTKAKTDKKK